MTNNKLLARTTLTLALTCFQCVRLISAEQPPDSNEELKALKSEIESLKAGQADIQKQIQEIKKLAQSQPGPRPSPIGKVVSVAGSPFKGEKTAKVTMLEFSEYQCPFCGVFSTTTMPKIEKEYVDTGKVKHVFRDFPLVRIHKFAFKAAEASQCAEDQGKYWEMHTRLFANNTKLTLEDLSAHAKVIGLDVPAFEQCLNSGKHAADVNKDLQDGEQLGLNSTPFFLLGLTEPDGSGLKVTAALSGNQPIEKFKEEIDKLLGQSQPSK